VSAIVPPGLPALTEDDRRQLLDIARQAVAAHLAANPFALPEVLAPGLRQGGAAFVTLRRRGDGELRGCIGTLDAHEEPLAAVVARMAVAAATHDPRFSPVTAAEMPSIVVEVSVLTPPSPIDPAAVTPGLHGLVVRHAGRSGLLLPQVATEHGWDRETFLDWTCRKAGLPPGAWKEPEASVLGFTAVVFSEEL